MTLVFLIGCGGSEPHTNTPASPEEVSGTSSEPSPHGAGAGSIDRGVLLAILDAGLGRFLQGVETEPVVVEGRFVGFRLVSLFPNDSRFQGVGIEPGDVVHQVNGQPIERPEQAIRVWDGLRVASELVIAYQRNGEPGEARFAIEEPGGEAAPAE